MADKLPTIAGYLCLGLVIVSFLATNLLRKYPQPLFPMGKVAVASAGLIAAIVFLLCASPPLSIVSISYISASACLCGINRKIGKWQFDWTTAATLFAVFCAATTIVWWRRIGTFFDISTLELVEILALMIAITRILALNEGTTQNRRHSWRFAQAVFLFTAALALFSTGLFHQPYLRWISWHHWSAYVGPAQLARAGAVLLRDIPVQYGMGPTALLALSCNNDCWSAMYWWAAATSLFYGVLMVAAAARICGYEQSRAQILVVTLSIFTSMFILAAGPARLGSPLLTPSESGLRFLPITLLIFFLVQRKDDYQRQPSKWIHLIWILGLLWSPESAFQTTAVWLPYYVWSTCRITINRVHPWRAFLLANARMACWFMTGCMLFLFIYWLTYDTAPTSEAYLAYVLHPPGPLPINPSGAICFFALIVLAGMVGMSRQLHTAADSGTTHNIVILLLATYGVTSYYLGRSHDNNLLNISVFFLLLLLAIRELKTPFLHRIVSCAAISALLACPIVANWSYWVEVATGGHLLEFRPNQVIANFSYASAGGIQSSYAAGETETAAYDTARGLLTINDRFHEPVTVLDSALRLEATSMGRPWSAFQGPENYAYLPVRLRRQFLANVANRLKAPGWLLIDRHYDAQGWLSDYDAVYRRDQQLNFNTYYAIRYVPR